jgi:hypothetical protein
MGNFASGLVGLVSSLVQGWTTLEYNEEAETKRPFGNFSERIRRRGSVRFTCGEAPVGRMVHAPVCQM